MSFLVVTYSCLMEISWPGKIIEGSSSLKISKIFTLTSNAISNLTVGITLATMEIRKNIYISLFTATRNCERSERTQQKWRAQVGALRFVTSVQVSRDLLKRAFNDW